MYRVERECVNSYRSRPLSIVLLMETPSRDATQKNAGEILIYEFLGLYDGTNT